MIIAKKIFLLIIAILLIYLLIPSQAFAGRTLIVGVNANWPPMQMKDSNGNICGYEIDLLYAIAQDMGLEIKLVDVPRRNLFYDLSAGKYDAVMALVSIARDTKSKFVFSDPYFFAEQVLLVPKNKPFDHLEGKVVGVFKLSKEVESIRSNLGCNIAYYTFEESEQAFKDLVKGYLDGVLCDSPLALNYLSKYPGKLTVKEYAPMLGKESANEKYAITVNKCDRETLELFNKGLQSVKEKGIESKLREKWFKENLMNIDSKSHGFIIASEHYIEHLTSQTPKMKTNR